MNTLNLFLFIYFNPFNRHSGIENSSSKYPQVIGISPILNPPLGNIIKKIKINLIYIFFKFSIIY